MTEPYPADRYVPETNPTLPCEECGTTERWSTIKQRGDWQVSNDPDVPFICPECQRQEERAESNRTLTEWSG